MLLVFTHNITPRIKYVFKHVLTSLLNVEINFTTKVEVFIAHEGPKMSYTHKPLGDEFFVRSTSLLFETSVEDVAITVSKWGEIPCFFKIRDEASFLPYDIFAASFYLLSRYEEYLPHVKDQDGRYPFTESVAYRYQFLDIPVIDYWVLNFSKIYNDFFSEAISLGKGTENTKILIAVERAYAYKNVGFIRSFGGFVKDFTRLRLKSVFRRIRVVLGFLRDPNDTFNWIIGVQKNCKKKFTVFFQVADYDGVSRNIKFSKTKFTTLIKMVADYCEVGLFISSQAASDVKKFRLERKRLEHIVHRKLESTVTFKNILDIPNGFREKLDQEVVKDYSMLYKGVLGFRAGTSFSFQFYDLDFEMVTPLHLHTVSVNIEDTLSHASKVIDRVAIDNIMLHCKKVNGTFTILFKNTSFSDRRPRNLLKAILNDK